MSNTKHLADLLKVCSILPALAIMPAMADVNTTGVSFLFGDISISDVNDIHYTAFGGHRGEWTDGKYNNSFPKYQMVGRSFELSDSVAYVGPVTINLRELTENDSLAYNYQKDGQDVDLAKLAGIDFGASDAEIFAAVAGVIGAENAEYTAPGVVVFANRDNTKEAGSLIFDKVTAVIDGATVNADTIEVKNGSSLSFVKQDPSLLSDATLFYTNKEDIASDGKTVLNANEITIEDSSIFVAEDAQLDIQASDIEIESESGNVMAEDGAVINIGTESAGDIEIASTDAETLWALNGGILNVGSADTKSVEISSVDNDAIYVGKKNSVVNINGKNISISTNTDGWGAVHVANKVITEDYDYADAATLNITGDNIKITAPETGVEEGIAVTAMSQGVVNVEGNTTIRAQNAILARGESQVNINTSGENTVKMFGDINFNYDEPTSGSSIDAFIDVTLAGADSVWTGNTVVTYDAKPEAEKLTVSNAKLTMKDGAVWNATKITDNKANVKGRYYTALNDLVIYGGTVNIADTERGIFVDRIVANDATFNGGMLNVNETINITSGTTVFNSAVLGDAGVLNLAEGATLDIGTSTVDLAELNINGTVLASVLSDRSYGSLNGAIVAGENGKVQLNVGSVGSYKIFDSQAEITVTAGATYDVSQEADGTVVITTKAVEDIAADTGLTTQAAGAIAGLANATDKNLQKISLAAQQVLNSGDVAAVERETKKLNPTDKPVAQATAASVQNQVLSLTSGRMAGGVSVGRAGGDAVSKENGFWMQGLFNKSKLADEFNGYTRGFALGADLLIDNKWTIGGGLAVNDSDVRSNTADIDIDSKTVFLYGQYKPNNWFVNATATYSMSEYTENKNPFGVMSGAAYDVESYGVQAMGGYDFAAGITAEAGLRYLHIAQDAYTDDLGFKVKATDTDFLSGVAGLKYAFAIENDWKVRLRPELRAAMTYDFISDDIVATVAMPGVASYKVDVERLSRMGGEFGIGLTALYRGMEVSLMYDLDLHKDYTSQTGMIKFRGQF